MGHLDVEGIELGVDRGVGVHGIANGGVHLEGGGGVDGLFGGATEVVCGVTHHAHARGIAGFDRGAFEKTAPGLNLGFFRM